MDVSHKRELYSGFGNSLAQAFELAVIPVLFGLMGWGIDSLVGTTPLFIVVFVLLALVGLGAKAYYTYKSQMEAHDSAAPWGRPQ